jgi:prophage regulatory protein
MAQSMKNALDVPKSEVLGRFPTRILRTREVILLTGLSRTTIWRMQLTNTFPRRVKLGLRATGFIAEHVYQWMHDLEGDDHAKK